MLSQLVLCCAVLAQEPGRVQPPGPQIAQAAQNPVLVGGVLVKVNPNLTHDFGRRFEVDAGIGLNVTFELVRDAPVTRNGQPARLLGLQTGDRVLLYRADMLSPTVLRIDAVGQ